MEINAINKFSIKLILITINMLIFYMIFLINTNKLILLICPN